MEARILDWKCFIFVSFDNTVFRFRHWRQAIRLAVPQAMFRTTPDTFVIVWNRLELYIDPSFSIPFVFLPTTWIQSLKEETSKTTKILKQLNPGLNTKKQDNMAIAASVYQTLLAHFEIVPVLAIAICLVWNKFCTGLYSIPGPPLAGFTNLWRLLDALQGRHATKNPQLHQKYKSGLIRLGPRVVSISNHELIPVIYSLNSRYNKTAFYTMFRMPFNG